MRTHMPRRSGYWACPGRVGPTQASSEPSAKRRWWRGCSPPPASKAASTCARCLRACSRNPPEVMPASTITSMLGPTSSSKRCAPCTSQTSERSMQSPTTAWLPHAAKCTQRTCGEAPGP